MPSHPAFRDGGPHLLEPVMALRPPRIFYGWYVVYAIGLVLLTASGLAFYNLSVLLDAFVAERGFPVALTSGATASFFIASGAGGVIAVGVTAGAGAHRVMLSGASLIGVTFRGRVGLHQHHQRNAL